VNSAQILRFPIHPPEYRPTPLDRLVNAYALQLLTLRDLIVAEHGREAWETFLGEHALVLEHFTRESYADRAH
jgi:hypothetical protein